jgi:hypothetical protein
MHNGTIDHTVGYITRVVPWMEGETEMFLYEFIQFVLFSCQLVEISYEALHEHQKPSHSVVAE